MRESRSLIPPARLMAIQFSIWLRALFSKPSLITDGPFANGKLNRLSLDASRSGISGYALQMSWGSAELGSKTLIYVFPREHTESLKDRMGFYYWKVWKIGFFYANIFYNRVSFPVDYKLLRTWRILEEGRTSGLIYESFLDWSWKSLRLQVFTKVYRVLRKRL